MNFSACFVFLLVVAQSYAQTPFDSLVDEVLWEAEQKMINESRTTMAIPDMVFPVDKKFLFWDLKGSIAARGGYVGNLSTVARIGDVDPEENGDLVITATFGMTDLFVHFDDIQVDFLFFHLKDGVDVKIGENAIEFAVAFHYDSDGDCTVTLNRAELTSVGAFHTTLRPEGLVHTLVDYLITAGLDMFSGTIQSTVNADLTSKLNDIIQQLDLCSKLPFATRMRLANNKETFH